MRDLSCVGVVWTDSCQHFLPDLNPFTFSFAASQDFVVRRIGLLPERSLGRGDMSTRPESTKFRSTSLRIIWCAAFLMVFGFAIGRQDSGAIHVVGSRWWSSLSAMPVIAGGILAFVGAVRMSLVMRPLNLLVFGVALVVATFAVPISAVQLFPALKTYAWTGASQVPIWLSELVGMMFFSTGVLRLLSDRTGPTR